MKLYSFEEFLNESKTKDGMWNVKLPSGSEIALPKSFTVSKTMPYSDFKLYKGTYKLKIAATKNKYVYYNQAFKSEVTLDDTDIINFDRMNDQGYSGKYQITLHESVNEGKSSTKMFTESDILKHPSYKKSSEMVQSISEDMEGNTFHHHFHITYPLSEMLGEDYKTFAEIGSFCGGSMCLMLQNKKGKSHISIDPFKAKPNQEKMFDNNTSKYIGEGQTLEKFVGLSDDPKIIKESCAAIEKAGGADIFFIDGSHAKHMVEKDFKNYEASVNPGGLIIFDDYMDSKDSPGVKKAVDGMVDDGMFEDYNVIGTIKNEAKAYSNGGSSAINNEYIIQKKIKDI